MSVPRRQCVSGSCNIHDIVLNEVLSNHLYSGALIFCLSCDFVLYSVEVKFF